GAQANVGPSAERSGARINPSSPSPQRSEAERVSTLWPQTTNSSANTANAYIEMPASSLAQMGNSIGSLPVGNGLTAQNVRLGVSGNHLTITTDIFWNSI